VRRRDALRLVAPELAVAPGGYFPIRYHPANGEVAMRINFRRFTDTHDVEIIVNPLSVRYLMAGVPGTTRMYFDDAHMITVRGTPHEVQQQLSDRRARRD
jgi:hypothetical protein